MKPMIYYGNDTQRVPGTRRYWMFCTDCGARLDLGNIAQVSGTDIKTFAWCKPCKYIAQQVIKDVDAPGDDEFLLRRQLLNDCHSGRITSRDCWSAISESIART